MNKLLFYTQGSFCRFSTIFLIQTTNNNDTWKKHKKMSSSAGCLDSGKKSKSTLSYQTFDELETMDLESPIDIQVTRADDQDNIRDVMKNVRLIRLASSVTGEPFLTTIANLDHPNRAKIQCWWCTLPFDDENARPVGIPCRYEQEINTYHMYGLFDCWECALAWCNESDKDISNQKLIHMWMRDIWSGEPWNIMHNVIAAPSRVILSSFGGFMSNCQYRDYIIQSRGDGETVSIVFARPNLNNCALLSMCTFVTYQKKSSNGGIIDSLDSQQQEDENVMIIECDNNDDNDDNAEKSGGGFLTLEQKSLQKSNKIRNESFYQSLFRDNNEQEEIDNVITPSTMENSLSTTTAIEDNLPTTTADHRRKNRWGRFMKNK